MASEPNPADPRDRNQIDFWNSILFMCTMDGVRQQLHGSLVRAKGHDLARLTLFKELFALPAFRETLDHHALLQDDADSTSVTAAEIPT